MKVGDYVFDSDLGLWGLILDRVERGGPGDFWLETLVCFTLLYEDGEQGDTFEGALKRAA